MEESHQEHLQPPPSLAPSQIPAQPTSANAADLAPLPDYDFRKRRRKWWALLAFALVLCVGVVSWRLFFESPLTPKEARQALVEFAATDPAITQYAVDFKDVPQQPVVYPGTDIVDFGEFRCDLGKREFTFPTPPRPRNGREVRGCFVYEYGFWKAKRTYFRNYAG